MSLKELRKQAGLTQIQVCKKIKWSQNDYSLLENGKRGIEAKKAKELANVLGVKLEKLIENL